MGPLWVCTWALTHKSKTKCVCVCAHVGSQACAYVGVWQRDAHSYQQTSPWSNFSIFYFHLCLPFKPYVFFCSLPLSLLLLISLVFLASGWSLPCLRLIFHLCSSDTCYPPPLLFWVPEVIMPCDHLIFYHYISSINLCLCLCVLACGRAPYLFLSLSRRGAVCHTMASNQGLFSSCLSLSLPQITTKWATWDFASLFEVLFTLSQLKIEIALSATKIWDDTAGHLLQIASWAMPLSTSIHPSIHPSHQQLIPSKAAEGWILSQHALWKSPCLLQG